MAKDVHPLFLLFFLLTSSLTWSQSYIGHSIDNYAGVHGVIYNPSSVVDSRLRADINLLSASSFVGSDYFSIDFNRLTNLTGGFEFDEIFEKNPKNDNQFFLNADVLGPSVLFNLNSKSSMALTTRVRAFFNLNNLNGLLYESVTDNFNEDENFNFELNNFTGTTHVWGEYGLTYGRILMDNQTNFLKGGISIKYLQGAGSTFLNAPEVTGQYDALNGMLVTTGTLNYGTTRDFDSGDVEFSNLSSGFGVDLGVTYEYRPQTMNDLPDSPNRYKLKVGVSLTDLGSISYDENELTTYDLDRTLDVNNFEGTDLETVLEENYEGKTQMISSKINLPTAFHLMLDYELKRRLFLNLQGSFSMINANREEANRIINTITATPRLETKWLSLYLPLSIRQYDGFAMGAGFRFGPFTAGSGSVITNLLLDDSYTTDFYVGLKIPLYK